MNIFKSTSFTWWQIGLLKLAVLCIGIAIGATWGEFFLQYALPLAGIGAILGIYLGYVWSKQR